MFSFIVLLRQMVWSCAGKLNAPMWMTSKPKLQNFIGVASGVNSLPTGFSFDFVKWRDNLRLTTHLNKS